MNEAYHNEISTQIQLRVAHPLFRDCVCSLVQLNLSSFMESKRSFSKNLKGYSDGV
jgi:hypothetical protein